MEYSKPVEADQYSVETSQLVTGHTLSTESYSTALVSLTTCVASSLLYHHTQPCTTRADNYCILVWAHGEKKIIHTDTNKQWKQTTSIVYLNLYVDNVYMVYVSYNNDDATHVVRLTSAVE